MNDYAPNHPVVKGCVEACMRCCDVADRAAAAGDGAYGVVGPHLRHCLEHLTCFLGGLAEGIVDYDARGRDVRLESDPVAFREAMDEALVRLCDLPPSELSRTMMTRLKPATGEHPVLAASTVERELLFVSSHTIHHLATIALVANKHGLVLPDGVDVAYSTAAYRATLAGAEQ